MGGRFWSSVFRPSVGPDSRPPLSLPVFNVCLLIKEKMGTEIKQTHEGWTMKLRKS